ncbi:MAG: hypothetical protein FWH05_00275 [Oscillospiraceae bacterium]|nr:hypothetical protein [Oscillospiraceae bacterium]
MSEKLGINKAKTGAVGTQSPQEGKKTRRKSVLTFVVPMLFFLFVVVVLVSRLVSYFTSTNRTEVALLYETTQALPFKGVFARDESIIRVINVGEIAYTHRDGTKLAKNSVIAKSYNSRNDIMLQNKITQIEEQIKILKDAETLKNTDNSQIDTLSNQLVNNHSALMSRVAVGNFEDINSFKNNFLSLNSKREIVRGTYNSFGGKAAELSNDITSLRAQISRLPSNVIADAPGYFVSKVDGYEGRINTQNIKDFTKEQLEEVIRNPQLPVPDNVIGKMIDNYKWQLVGIFDSAQTRGVYVGLDMRLRLGSSSKVTDVRVKSVNQNGDDSIIIFECDILTDEFLQSRTAQFNLLMNNYKGLRISRSALRFNDSGEQGVLIRVGVELVFVKVKILLNEEDFVIVEDTTEQPGYLSLYNIVMVSGVDLYEGKIVDEREL